MRKTANQIASSILNKYAATKKKQDYQNYYSDPIHPESASLMQQWDDRYMGGKPWPKNMVPIAGNGFGDMAVRDSDTQKLYEYLHEQATPEAPFRPFQSDKSAIKR